MKLLDDIEKRLEPGTTMVIASYKVKVLIDVARAARGILGLGIEQPYMSKSEHRLIKALKKLEELGK